MIYDLDSKVDNIWNIISTNHPELRPNEVSKDVFLEPIVTHDLTIKTTIHHTNTVSLTHSSVDFNLIDGVLFHLNHEFPRTCKDIV
jgi:hypothetical protein